MGQLRTDFPTITVEADFSNGLGVWTDISAYVRGFTVTRGRTNELTPFQSGTATIVLNNRDRRFEPEYASSPYYPYVTPLRPVRISATWSGTTYYLYQGFVAEWPLDWSRSPEDQETAITCVDGFEILNQAWLTTSFSAELSGTRILNVLTAAGWNTSATSLDAGLTTVQASDLAQTSALQHLQDVANTELGQFYIDEQGNAVFEERSKRSGTVTSAATYGDDISTEVPYETIEMSYTKELIRNDIQVTRNGGTLQEEQDTSSQTSYFVRTYSVSTLHNSDADADSLALYILSLYKDPHLRVNSVTLRPTLKPATCWPEALGRKISDRVTTVRRPPAGGASISFDSFIDGINHTVQKQGKGWAWRTTFNLTPAGTSLAFVLGSSQLGTSTVLSF